jgi:hypothetical protein
MIASILAAFALATGGSASVVSPPSTDALLKRAEYEQVQISPDGTLLAIAHRIDDGTEVTVLRRADHQLVTRVDPGSRGEVSSLQ